MANNQLLTYLGIEGMLSFSDEQFILKQKNLGQSILFNLLETLEKKLNHIKDKIWALTRLEANIDNCFTTLLSILTQNERTLLYFSPLLGSNQLSLESMKKILQSTFCINIDIKSHLVLRKEIPTSIQSKLGINNSTLGKSAVIGDGYYKFENELHITVKAPVDSKFTFQDNTFINEFIRISRTLLHHTRIERLRLKIIKVYSPQYLSINARLYNQIKIFRIK